MVHPTENVEARLEEIIDNGGSIEDCAELWATVMYHAGVDWPRMNAAIRNRWPNCLSLVKGKAQRIHERANEKK